MKFKVDTEELRVAKEFISKQKKYLNTQKVEIRPKNK